jgi:HEAT repeat protein
MNASRLSTLAALIAVLLLTPGCRNTPHSKTQVRTIDRSSHTSLQQSAIELLQRAAQSDTPLFRANAIEGLEYAPSQAAPLVLKSLDDPNLGVRFAAAMMSGRLQLHEAIPALRELQQDHSLSVQSAAVGALVMLNEKPSRQPLARTLFSGSARERAQAAFVLGEIGDPTAVPMLLDAAQESVPRSSVLEDKILRLQIAEALVKLGHEESIEPIRAALFPSRPQELEIAALAIQIIGQVDDRRSVDQLVYMSQRQGKPGTGEEPLPAEIRLACAASLAQLGLPRGGFIAREFIENDSPSIRAQAAMTLGLIADRADLPILAKMMDDPDGTVAIAAAAAMVRILPENVLSEIR